jgi:NAD+ kinase
MKHFVVIANAYKDRNFALTNKIVAYIEQKGGTAKGLMSNVEAISDNEFELEDIPQDTQCILVRRRWYTDSCSHKGGDT